VSVTQLSKASLYGILNIFTVDFNDDDDDLYENNLNHTDERHILLENLSQRENDLLNTQIKIFFIQTSENEDILPRHACSI
jgi:hypothetical protein